MKITFIISFISLIFVAYTAGFVSGVKNMFPYKTVKKIKAQISTYNLQKNSNLNTCEILEISELPSVFSVLIGHAYGAPSKSKLDSFIAPNVENFLLKNNSKIQNIIFTGDIFSVPSSSKWERLFEKFGKSKIFISPGNHDILRPDSEEIFLKNKFIRKNFPFDLSFHDNLSLIIDDSISSNWRAGKDLEDFIKLALTQKLSNNSWVIDLEKVNKETLDISVSNPNIIEKKDDRPPEEIISEIEDLNKETSEILQKIKKLL